jgi:hypothetical protein
MPISPEDRAKWDRQVAGLREAQTEQRPSPERLAQIIADANRWRAAHGIPPLRGEFDDIPEEAFYERARRLGLLKGGR